MWPIEQVWTGLQWWPPDATGKGWVCPGGEVGMSRGGGTRTMWPIPWRMWCYLPSPCPQTDACENITFPQLRLRAVIKSAAMSDWPTTRIIPLKVFLTSEKVSGNYFWNNCLSQQSVRWNYILWSYFFSIECSFFFGWNGQNNSLEPGPVWFFPFSRKLLEKRSQHLMSVCWHRNDVTDNKWRHWLSDQLIGPSFYHKMARLFPKSDGHPKSMNKLTLNEPTKIGRE